MMEEMILEEGGFGEKEIAKISESIAAMEDKNFCPSCWMILSFSDVVNFVSTITVLQYMPIIR
jgi:hypothetical protein